MGEMPGLGEEVQQQPWFKKRLLNEDGKVYILNQPKYSLNKIFFSGIVLNSTMHQSTL